MTGPLIPSGVLFLVLAVCCLVIGLGLGLVKQR